MEHTDGLRAGELDRLRAALVAAGVGAWAWDLATDAVQWSDGVAGILGLETAAFDGTYPGYLRLLSPTDRIRIQTAVEECLSGRQASYFVVHAVGERWIEARGCLVRDATGAPRRLEGTVCDITARKLAEDEACNSLAFAENLLATVGAVVTVLDRQGRIVRFNPTAERVTGYRADEVTGRVFWDLLVPPEQRAGVRAVFDRLSAGMFPTRHENDWIARDGRRIWIAWANTAVCDAAGEVELIVGTGIERTLERDAAERDRQELERRVAERTAELEAFSYSVSHDLRGPLRAIDGYTMGVLMGAADRLDEESRSDLARVRVQTQRMAHLIDDLLALSRVGRAPLEKTDVDASQIAVELLAGYAAMEPERAVHATVEPGIAVHADAGLLRVMLDNLLGNAWKFTSDRSPATITVTAIAGGFAVADDGAGFDMAHAGKLFGAFQRLHRDDQFAGTGIGLATVHRIVARHGGAIAAESEPGRGTTFRVTLP